MTLDGSFLGALAIVLKYQGMAKTGIDSKEDPVRTELWIRDCREQAVDHGIPCIGPVFCFARCQEIKCQSSLCLGTNIWFISRVNVLDHWRVDRETFGRQWRLLPSCDVLLLLVMGSTARLEPSPQQQFSSPATSIIRHRTLDSLQHGRDN
jgi:hypothetical protein